MFLQTTTEFDHDFGINLTLHERKKREKTEIKILAFDQCTSKMII